jgi:hypothetical protein
MAAPTVFDPKRPSINEARSLNILMAHSYFSEHSSNTKVDDLHERQRPSTVLLF